MLPTDTDENYPSYVGWEVSQALPIHKPDEFGEDALEQSPKPSDELADELADELKADATPPVLNSEGASDL